MLLYRLKKYATVGAVIIMIGICVIYREKLNPRIVAIIISVAMAIALLYYSRNRDQSQLNILKIMENFRQVHDSNLTYKDIKINMPILYINLEQNKDRREFMENQFKRYNLKSERIEGVYGKSLKSLEFSSPEDNLVLKGNFGYKNNCSNLTAGEVGCTLAHLKAILTAYERNYEMVMIVEDDCCFDLLAFTGRSISKIVNDAPKDWELLQMYSFKCNRKNPDDELFKRHVRGSYCFSNACYIINKKGMQSLFEKTGYLKDKIFVIGSEDKTTHLKDEGVADAIIYDHVVAYTFTIPIFFTNNRELESTIHADHTDYHNSCVDIVMNDYGITDQYLYSNYDEKQIKMAITLFDMADELDKLNIEYFLTCGTLLGYYREGKFIRGDPDIDLGCFRRNFKDTRGFPKKLGNLILEKSYGKFDFGYELTYRHSVTNINLDIFFYYDLDSESIYSATYTGLCDKAKNGMCRWKTPKFGLKKIDFLNRKFNVPADTETFLENRYGVNWNVPMSYGYNDGLDKGFYKGLILSDFENEKIKNRENGKKEVKICEWFPVKIKNSPNPIVWIYKNNSDQIPKSQDIFTVINIDDDLIRIISRNIDFKKLESMNVDEKLKYVKYGIVLEYGGVWIDQNIPIKKIIGMFNRLIEYNCAIDSVNGIIVAKPNNRYIAILKKQCESPTMNMTSHISTLKKLYPTEYMKM